MSKHEEQDEMTRDLLNSRKVAEMLTPKAVERVIEALKLHGYSKVNSRYEVGDLPIKGQVLRWADLHHDSTTIEPERDMRVVTDAEHANIINSDVADSWASDHKILLDIDFPVTVIESSPGHSHLYIDHAVTWDQLVMLMTVLTEIGLVERGYTYASIQRGYTSLRVPWALKGTSVPEPPDSATKRAVAPEPKDPWDL
ncbi:hypothetical protein SEA_CRUNCHYBOI_20 [Microbacterium phage CrunchyBoi]|nr:hypothetical protein SEA_PINEAPPLEPLUTO_20 [Microbacterium phage PineapplePluto]QQO39363.1 hypothetical protein SEA_CRUNCHYBOI_20 [Microbacterium phage CrunchyBoi]